MLQYLDHTNYRSEELVGQGQCHALVLAICPVTVELIRSDKHCTYP